MTQKVDPIVQDGIVGETVVKKKVDELSLDEIKNELEKRQLDASGDDYAILHERLTDNMIEEGLDPASFEFEIEAEEDDEEEEEEQQPSAKEQSTPKETPKSIDQQEEKEVTQQSTPVAQVASSTTENGTEKPSESAKEVAGNHIWVSGLSSRCRAAELKKFFLRIAPVGSAKIVAKARTSSAQCYGYITVDSADDLKKCVEKLHGTRFEGSFIKVEICKLGPADQLRKVEMEHRRRMAQQKEEFNRRKAQRRERIEAENKARVAKRLASEAERKKDQTKKKNNAPPQKPKNPPAAKGESKNEPRPRNPRAPAVNAVAASKKKMPQSQNLRKKSLKRLDRRSQRRRSPPNHEMQGRRRTPSPFRQNMPGGLPPHFHGDYHGNSGMPRFHPMDQARFMDRRLDEERNEVARRQRAEAEALERERRQLRLEKEKLEREKLDLIRLERERVKKEMEEIALRKKMAENGRRHGDAPRQDERKPPHVEIDRRMRDDARMPLPAAQAQPMDAYNSRATLPVDNYSRVPIETKFSGRLGPPTNQRDPGRMDDRRRDDRRRDPLPLPSQQQQRDDRRHPETYVPWTSGDMKNKNHFNGQQQQPQQQLDSSRKRGRSRSPLNRSSMSFVNQLQQSYGSMARSMDNVGDNGAWGSRAPVGQSAYNNDRNRSMGPQSRGMDQQHHQGDNGWQSNNSRVAFPPAYSEQTSIRGFVGGHASNNGGFGLSNVSSSSYRRY